MGKIVHEVPLHTHEEPPDPKAYGIGTIWECECGQQRRLEDSQHDGLCWVYINGYTPPFKPWAAKHPPGCR